jgi:RNA polymerase sigma factor (sigma-70 family)
VPHRRSDTDLLSSRTPEDFGVFYQRHAAAVIAYVTRRVRTPELLYDLVGETFARALEHRRHYDPRRGPAVTWLLGFARHLMVEAERHGQVADAARVRLGLEPVVLDEEALARIRKRSRVDLLEALADLPESQRNAAMRRVLGELEYGALAPHVRCSAQILPEPVQRRRMALRRG